MAQHLLDRAQVASVRRADGWRRSGGGCAGSSARSSPAVFGVAQHDLVEALAGQRPAPEVDEQLALVVRADHLRPPGPQVDADRGDRLAADRARAAPSTPCRGRERLPCSRSTSSRSPARSSPRPATPTRTSAPAAPGRAASRDRRRAAVPAGAAPPRSPGPPEASCPAAASPAERPDRPRSPPRGAGGGRRSAGRRPCGGRSRSSRARRPLPSPLARSARKSERSFGPARPSPRRRARPGSGRTGAGRSGRRRACSARGPARTRGARGSRAPAPRSARRSAPRRDPARAGAIVAIPVLLVRGACVPDAGTSRITRPRSSSFSMISPTSDLASSQRSIAPSRSASGISTTSIRSSGDGLPRACRRAPSQGRARRARS